LPLNTFLEGNFKPAEVYFTKRALANNFTVNASVGLLVIGQKML